MWEVLAIWVHWILAGLVLIAVGTSYFKVRAARKAGQKDVVIPFGQFNAAQTAPRWFALLMNGVAVLITILCASFIVFALFFLLKT